jgi:hypothetical protein
MATSRRHEFRSQADPVSGELKYWLVHGVVGLQICTLAIGAAEVGPKLGTGWGVAADGDGLALVDEVGVGDGVPAVLLEPWCPTRLTSTIPRINTTTTPTATGIIHGGSSARTPARRSRAIAGLRTGGGEEARGGLEARGTGGGVSTRCPVVSGGGAGAAAAAARAAAEASAATDSSPGQAGATMGVQVRSTGAGPGGFVPGAAGEGAAGVAGGNPEVGAGAGGLVPGRAAKGGAAGAGDAGGMAGGAGALAAGGTAAPGSGALDSHRKAGTSTLGP